MLTDCKAAGTFDPVMVLSLALQDFRAGRNRSAIAAVIGLQREPEEPTHNEGAVMSTLSMTGLQLSAIPRSRELQGNGTRHEYRTGRTQGASLLRH